jgi:hypothetical protein
MKQYFFRIYGLLAIALVCVALSGCATTSGTPSGSTASAAATASKNAGLLVINRSANFGTDLTLLVWVDGKQVAQVTDGQNYSGSLSPGPHAVSVVAQPNRQGLKPTQKSVTAVAGKTYTFTAMWQGAKLALM